MFEPTSEERSLAISTRGPFPLSLSVTIFTTGELLFHLDTPSPVKPTTVEDFITRFVPRVKPATKGPPDSNAFG